MKHSTCALAGSFFQRILLAPFFFVIKLRFLFYYYFISRKQLVRVHVFVIMMIGKHKRMLKINYST